MTIPDFFNISIANVKKLLLNIFFLSLFSVYFHTFFCFFSFLIKKVCASLSKTVTLRFKLKKVHRVLEFNKSQVLKPYVEFNTQKKTEATRKL